MTGTPVEHTRMTLEQFKALPETLQPTELIGGELIVSPTPKNIHQELVFALARLLYDSAPHGRTVLSPMDVYFSDDTVLQPDVFWVREGSTSCRLGTDGYWHGAPELVVEVLSPGTAARDRGEKYDIYAANGVTEYWIADPHNTTLEVYILAQSAFKRQGAYSVGVTFTSPTLDKVVEMSRIFS